MEQKQALISLEHFNMTITQENFDLISNAALVIIFIGFITIAPLWIILTIKMPRKVIEKYFKSPHFNINEIDLMSSFPLNMIRTAIFCLASEFPFLGRKRGIEDCKQLMPLWFKLISKSWITISLLTFLSFVVMFSLYNIAIES